VAFNTPSPAPTQTANSPLDPFTVTATSPTGGYGSTTYTYSSPNLPCDVRSPSQCDHIDPTTGTVSGTLAHLNGKPVTFTVVVTSTDPANSHNTITATCTETIQTSTGVSPTATPTAGATT
jgi:hypothetical protein